MRSQVLSILFAVATFPAFAAAASPASKPAWQWTLDERLAARFAETARNQRVDDYLGQQEANRSQRSTAVNANRPTDVIRGSAHPELLLPFEIFTNFTRAAFEEDDETARIVQQDAAKRAVPLGLPADFLLSWKSISGHFISSQQKELQLRRELNSGKVASPQVLQARINEVSLAECRSRADAMRDLRAKFGTAFDQFLYEVAAPNVFRNFYEPVSAQKLRDVEGGCR
jgi:hypothetical protein